MTGYSNQPIPQQAARELLALPLEDKVLLSCGKIEEWYDAWDGKCYVSFSGGKDSTVLAYLAAQELSRYRTPIYPLTLVFVNTFCIGGGEWDADGLWKPNEKGLGYGRVLDYIGVRY